MRERGLKLAPPYELLSNFRVAPRAGAWIETHLGDTFHQPAESLPVRERGLKPFSSIQRSGTLRSLPVRERGLKPTWWVTLEQLDVAPRAGAWIETVYKIDALVSDHVAPRAGAWIETFAQMSLEHQNMSLPVRERGLKQYL